MSDLIYLAEQALTEPSDYGYHGDLDLFNTWGFVYAKHRDSDLLVQSNYDVWLKELKDEEYEDEWEIVHSGHWAVGWVDHIAVRVLKEEGEITEDNITDVFRKAVELKDAEEAYALLDEDDFCQREYDETLDNIKQEAPGFIDSSNEGWESEVFTYLHNQGDYAEAPDYWYEEKLIVEAAYNLGFIDEEWLDDWKEYVDEHPEIVSLTTWEKYETPGTSVYCGRCGEANESFTLLTNGEGYCSLFCADRAVRQENDNQESLEVENV